MKKTFKSIKEIKSTESSAQVELFKYLRGLQELGAPFLAAAIPNGTYSNIRTAIKAKAEGLTAGMPDVILNLSGGRVIYIEHKIKGNYLSKSQKAVQARLKSLGHEVITITVLNGHELIDAWEKLLKENGAIK